MNQMEKAYITELWISAAMVLCGFIFYALNLAVPSGICWFGALGIFTMMAFYGMKKPSQAQNPPTITPEFERKEGFNPSSRA